MKLILQDWNLRHYQYNRRFLLFDKGKLSFLRNKRRCPKESAFFFVWERATRELGKVKGLDGNAIDTNGDETWEEKVLSLKYILRHRRCCDDRFRVGDVWLVIKLHSEKIVVYWSGAIKPTRLADSTVAKDDAFEDPRPDAVGLRLAGGERRWNDFTARGASEISDLFVLLLAVCTRNIERHSDA